MSIAGVPHLRAVRALERAGFRVVRQGKHIIMSDGERILTIPRHDPVNANEFTSYENLPEGITREFVNHLESYVQGNVHTNGMENFWSLLKRTLKGTYVSVDPVHLQAYVDEQAFRFNNREYRDEERFVSVLSQIAGKRLTFSELITKELDSPSG